MIRRCVPCLVPYQHNKGGSSTFETQGKMSTSFEKIVERIESRLPFNQMMEDKYRYGVPFGEVPYGEEQSKVKEFSQNKPPDDGSLREQLYKDMLFGTRTEVKGSASPATFRHRERPKYDKTILKTSTCGDEYHYTQKNLKEKEKKRLGLLLGFGCAAVMGSVGISRWLSSAAYDGSDDT